MKKQCKNCGSRVDHFNIDYEAGLIRCFYCVHALPTEMFFTDLTINKFAEKIPEERRDEFMVKLGFEKKPVHKTAIIAGTLIALIPLIISLKQILEKQDDVGELIRTMVFGIILLIPLIKAFLNGKDSKYVKKK